MLFLSNFILASRGLLSLSQSLPYLSVLLSGHQLRFLHFLHNLSLDIWCFVTSFYSLFVFPPTTLDWNIVRSLKTSQETRDRWSIFPIKREGIENNTCILIYHKKYFPLFRLFFVFLGFTKPPPLVPCHIVWKQFVTFFCSSYSGRDTPVAWGRNLSLISPLCEQRSICPLVYLFSHLLFQKRANWEELLW